MECYKTQVFFFFKQKTAYEMRISDWSSDVCSSDLSFWRQTRTIIAPASHETRDAWDTRLVPAAPFGPSSRGIQTMHCAFRRMARPIPERRPPYVVHSACAGNGLAQETAAGRRTVRTKATQPSNRPTTTPEHDIHGYVRKAT